MLTSGGGMQYGRAAYQAQAGKLTLGVSYAYFHYSLEKQFAVLNAHGDEQIASVFASYPLVRSYNNNLQLRAAFDYRILQDDIDAFDTTSHPGLFSSLYLSLDRADRVWPVSWSD